jgi:hypothetical protein
MCESRGAPVLLVYNKGVGPATSGGSGHVIFNGALSQSGNSPPTHTRNGSFISNFELLPHRSQELKSRNQGDLQGFWFFL